MKAYKYRSIEDEKILERDLNTFSENQFFAPTFEMLNDPFEANFNEVISNTANGLKDIFSISTENILECLKEVTNYKYKLGIYSLSKSWDIEQMWAYYASSNKGYCVEYEIEKLKDKTRNLDFSNQLNITYSNQRPTLNIEDINNGLILNKMFGTKKEKWKPENETRLIFDNSSLKNHHDSAITAIYFGSQTESSLIENFKNKFKNRDLKYYKILVNIEKNHLERELIFESSKMRKFDISQYKFEIIKHKNNPQAENYYIYLEDVLTTAELKEFALAFREKYCYKLCNLNIFNTLEVIDIIDEYPLKNKNYIKYAEAFIALADFSTEKIIIEYPYKDFYYKELIEQK